CALALRDLHSFPTRRSSDLKHVPANGRISLLSVASRAHRASVGCQIKTTIFSQKNRLHSGPICWIERALYAKATHHDSCHSGVLGVLSTSGIGAGVFRAEPEICLHRCFREKAIRRRRRQILSKENRQAVCKARCKY